VLFFLSEMASPISAQVHSKTHHIGDHSTTSIMSHSTPQLPETQVSSFKDDGFLIVRDALSPEETKALQSWAQEVHDLPRTRDVPWMPYEVGEHPWPSLIPQLTP
jgi:hypothetical protein